MINKNHDYVLDVELVAFCCSLSVIPCVDVNDSKYFCIYALVCVNIRIDISFTLYEMMKGD